MELVQDQTRPVVHKKQGLNLLGDVVIIIPAYQPPRSLIKLVKELLQEPYAAIIVVNDGSSAQHAEIFSSIAPLERVKILRHAVNLGKGTALKSAFNEVLNSFPNVKGAVTIDADGQHLPADIRNVALALSSEPGRLHLGTRLFKGVIPLRSRFGNSLTRMVFHYLIGRSLQDTQTGLRGIPLKFLPNLLKLKTHGYEFELDMLIQACHNGLTIKEVPIETVYETGNPTSHFNPLLDSFKIYFVFLRYTLTALLSFLAENVFFIVSHMLTGNIFGSMVVGRVTLGALNFLATKTLVFKSKGRIWVEAFQYLALAMFSMLASYVLILIQTRYLNLPLYPAKIMAEAMMFFVNFAAQRTFIFVNPTDDEVSETSAEQEGA